MNYYVGGDWRELEHADLAKINAKIPPMPKYGALQLTMGSSIMCIDETLPPFQIKPAVLNCRTASASARVVDSC